MHTLFGIAVVAVIAGLIAWGVVVTVGTILEERGS